MALAELIAALEREAATQVAELRAGAAREAAERRAAAAAEAAERRERTLAVLDDELAADQAASLAAVRRGRRQRELASRAALLDRLRAALRRVAVEAESELPPAALRSLLAAAREYVPRGPAVLRCPSALRARVEAVLGTWASEAAGEAVPALSLEEAAPGEPLALLAAGRTLCVDCGLPAQAERRWPALAIELLAALDGEEAAR